MIDALLIGAGIRETSDGWDDDTQTIARTRGGVIKYFIRTEEKEGKYIVFVEDASKAKRDDGKPPIEDVEFDIIEPQQLPEPPEQPEG